MPSPFARPDQPRNSGRTFVLVAVAIAAIAVSIGFAASRRNGSSTHAYKRPVCSAETTVTCLVSWKRTDTGGEAVFNRPAGRVFRFGVGEASDVAEVGNWFCGIEETLAVYRPRTGAIYYFPTWPTGGDPVSYLADATGLVNARVGVGERNGDNCADLALKASNGDVTWFLPVTQRNRLVEHTTPNGPTPGTVTP